MSQPTFFPPPPGQTPQAVPVEMNTFPMRPQPPADFIQNQQSGFQNTANGQSPNEKPEFIGVSNGESTSPQPNAGQATSSGELELNGESTGAWNGGAFRICHRDSNTTLTVRLCAGVSLWAKPGAMVAMTPSMILRGTVSFSWMKLLTRSDFAKSEYVGTRVPTPQKPDDFDQVVLAPNSLGDIASVAVDTDKPGAREWRVGRDAFLAATSGVDNDYTAQKLTQAVFSGEGFFIYTFRGYGFLWIQSFGGIVEHKLEDETQEIIIDNNHLVAWDCNYTIQRVASGGIVSGISSREGLACRFTGPGTVYYQTRKLEAFAAQLKVAGR